MKVKPDRLAYLWLAIALVLSLFANGRWAIPLAVWLAPVFLLRFVRIQKVLWGVTLALCVNFVAMTFVCQELLRPLSFGLATYLLALGFAILTTLPYLVDRLITTRLQGFMATLIFPLAYTSMEYLNSLVNPFGTYLSIAYTQYGNLPLVQLVSVTGIWGLTFLISWLAPVVNWAWERDFGWSKVRRGSLLYGGMLSLVQSRNQRGRKPARQAQTTQKSCLNVLRAYSSNIFGNGPFKSGYSGLQSLLDLLADKGADGSAYCDGHNA